MMAEGGACFKDDHFEGDHDRYKAVARDLRDVTYCKKNPGHANFISTGDLSIDHLPHLYRDNDVFQLVKATSDITFLLKRSGDSSQTKTSEFKARRVGEDGTGWITGVFKFTDEDNVSCACSVCTGTQTPKKTWGEIHTKTAAHVVQNDAEARQTKCYFFLDSNKLGIKDVPSLPGLRVMKRDLNDDTCEMVCATHDVVLVNKLYRMHRRWSALNRKVHDKYSRCDARPIQGAEGGSSDKNNNVCIIVSHPHGHSKHITVGTWEERYPAEVDDSCVKNCVYTYSTPTCTGSSGAPVITLPKDGVRILCWSNYPPHSGTRRDVAGVSGGNREIMLLPRDERH